MTYEMIKHNYERGLWNKKMVALAVQKEVITVQEYKEIVGKDFDELSSL